LWFGFGQRSSYHFKRILDVQFENTKFIVRGLELIDPKFHHLNTCFCPLETGQLLWYPPAFSEHSRGIIETWYENNNFEISEVDARALACNSISVGWNIIMPEISKGLRDILYINGYDVIQLDMGEFILGGGACKSLVLEPIQKILI
jgi:ornithine--oxo-acid transaminase